MKTSINLKSLPTQLRHFFLPVIKRHMMISFMAITGFMIFAIVSINHTISNTVDEEYEQTKQAEVINTRFDTATIEKINQLKSRQENSSLNLPSGRRNPFTE